MMNATTKMVSEMNVLRTVCALHKSKIDAAFETADDIALAFETHFGFSPWEAPEYAPAYTAAKALVSALSDDDGYYWATSRLMDLERVLGASWAPQTLLFRDIPEAHASVGAFVASTLGYSVAA